MRAAVVSRKGPVRDNNEDNYYMNGCRMKAEETDAQEERIRTCADAFQVYAVCDGMGGTDSGEAASACAVGALADRAGLRSAAAGGRELVQMLREISGTVLDEALRRGKSAGTTIALVHLQERRLRAANVGDSRIYRFRKGKLWQISEDHSRVAQMVRMGLISPEQARTDPGRHVISQYLGMPDQVLVSPCIRSAGTIKRGDIYLLCSDGLTDMLTDSEIRAILEEGGDSGEIARALSEAALRRGGRDNVTVMILQVCPQRDAGR